MSSLPIDINIFQTLHSVTLCSGSPLDKFNLFISNNSIHIWILIILFTSLVQGKRGIYSFCICLAGFFIAWYLTDEYLKPLFNVPRPFLVIKESCVYGFKPTSGSFPSGHMITSSTMASLIYLFNRKNWLLNIISIAFALYVGYTRIYLGVHFPSDIMAGALFGALIATIWFYSTEYGRKNYDTLS